MSTFYHSSDIKYEVGQIIQPGNWGRKIKEIGTRHPSWNREITLEAVRINYFPTKPSRLESTFCCNNLETIKAYHHKNNPDGIIYLVDFVDQRLPYHIGDFNAVEPLPGRPENMVQIANLYWTNGLHTQVDGWPGIDCTEIVSNVALKVLEIISYPNA